MEAVDELLTIAEIAIGLAGFSGVVVAFTRGQGLRGDDRYYFVALLSTAFTAVLIAFTPAIFYHAGFAGPALWIRSSAVMLIVWVITTATMYVRVRGITLHPVGHWFSAAQYALAFACLSSQVANLVGWPMETGAALYLVGLVLWLASGGLVFALLVLVGAQE